MSHFLISKHCGLYRLLKLSVLKNKIQLLPPLSSVLLSHVSRAFDIVF